MRDIDPADEIGVAIAERRQRRTMLEVGVRAAVLGLLAVLVLAAAAVARLGTG